MATCCRQGQRTDVQSRAPIEGCFDKLQVLKRLNGQPYGGTPKYKGSLKLYVYFAVGFLPPPPGKQEQVNHRYFRVMIGASLGLVRSTAQGTPRIIALPNGGPLICTSTGPDSEVNIPFRNRLLPAFARTSSESRLSWRLSARRRAPRRRPWRRWRRARRRARREGKFPNSRGAVGRIRGNWSWFGPLSFKGAPVKFHVNWWERTFQ